MFPIPVATKNNTTTVRNATNERAIFEAVYNDTPDLRAWHGTAWGVLGAYTDMASHREPLRATTTFEQKRFARNAIGGQDTALAQEVLMRVATGATA
jgi:squalene cyclase